MLVFHIHSPKTGKQGERVVFYFQDIFIGNSHSSHIGVPSPDRDQNVLRVTHQKEGVLLESVENFPYLLNGKKIIGSKVFKINDILTIGEISITLKESDFSQANPSLNLEERYDFFFNNHQEYETILTALERELILADE